MRRYAGIIPLLLLPLGLSATGRNACGSSAPAPSSPLRVLFIGVDGATWHMIDPLIEAGRLPNFQALKRAGSYGTLTMTHGAIFSPTVWTSMFTGVDPDRHGLLGRESSLSYFRRRKAVWNLMSESGRPSVVLNLPGTYPPEPILGCMISGFPFERLVIGDAGGEFISLGEGGAGPADMHGTIDVRDIETGTVFHFDLTVSPPPDGGPYRFAMAYGDTVRTFAMGHDEWSPWILFDLAPDLRVKTRLRFRGGSAENAFLVYMQPLQRLPGGTWSYFHLSNGYADLRDAVETYSPLEIGWWRIIENPLALGFLYGNLVENERRRAEAGVRIYRAAEWPFFAQILTLTDRASHPFWPYMDPGPYDHVTPELAERFGDLVKMAYVESDSLLGAFLDVADENTVIIVASDHGFRSATWMDTMRRTWREIQESAGVLGWFHALQRIHYGKGFFKKPIEGMHDKEGIYIFSGPGVRSNHAGRPIHAVDIAPTILYLLGEGIPDDLDGRIVEDAFEPGRLARDAPRYVDGMVGRREADVREMSPSAIEQLKSMGYIK